MVGTETYRTVSGASNTVFLLKPFDLKIADPFLKVTPQATPAAAKKTPKKPVRSAEQAAASKLKLAKTLLNKGRTVVAEKRLQELTKQHPDTEAA